MLAGVIGMSPLVLQTTPVSKLLRKAGAAVSIIAPWLPFPAEVPTEVRSGTSEAIGVRLVLHPPKTQGAFERLALWMDWGSNTVVHDVDRTCRMIPPSMTL